VKVLSEILRNRYLLALAVGLAAVFAVSFLLPPAAKGLARFFAYMSLACNTIPLPATPVVLYMGREYPWVAVALVGAAATSLANLVDYEIFTSVFKTKLLRKIKDGEHSQASIRAFQKVAFLALVGANVVGRHRGRVSPAEVRRGDVRGADGALRDTGGGGGVLRAAAVGHRRRGRRGGATGAGVVAAEPQEG
jgi:hypothetical protein